MLNGEIQGHNSSEISPLNWIKHEHPFFVIETAGEPRMQRGFDEVRVGGVGKS